MKPTNLEGVGSHAQAIIRGWVDEGLTFRTGTTTAIDVRDLNIIGGTLTRNADGTWTLTIGGTGGTPGSGGVPTGSSPVNMLNNSARDLLPGDVVVVDGDADTAVTTTTTAGDTHIAGVVQTPIAIGAIGPVVFNGYTPLINAPDAVRGEYAKTTTTDAQATSTTDREAGSFAVYVTGDDLPDFASSAVVTRQTGPVETLSITMPGSIPVDRALFLALWLIDATAVAVPGWTLIGAEAGFTYYYRISSGGDSATATWTGVSTAVAVVLLLHPSVSLAVPVEDHDYENTAAAASLSGLDTAVAHYAIAGVNTDVATPGSGFTRLAGGTAGTVSAGTPTLVQSKFTDAHNATDPSTTFDSTLTAGNLMLAVPFMGGSDTWTTDPRLGIPSCGIDTAMTKLGKANTNNFGSSGINVVSMLGKNVDAGDLYSGPFGTNALCLEPITASLLLMEFSGISLASYDVLSSEGFDSSPVNLGTFSGVGSDDLLIMALVKKRDGYGGSPDPAVDSTGWTQIVDGYYLTNGWAWVGYKVGDGAASVSYTSDGFGGWGAMAVLIRQGAAFAEGTLAGKYIGHDAAVTSPFTGANQDDGIFAINLLADSKASALLYGPDLGGSGSFSGDASDVPFTPAGTISATDVQAAIEEVAAEAGSGSLPWFVVTDYGATGDGATDDTAAINDAIDALVAAGGGVLYFPATPDSYKVTAGLNALSVPALVLGDGAAGTPSAQDDALSRITFDDDTGVLFSVTANHVAFVRIALHYVGSTPSAGAGIQVPAGGAARSRGYFGQYHQVSVKGFWTNVDLEEGGQWAMTDSQIRDPKKYGIRTLNTTSPDEGDWSISGIQFDASGLSPDAAIRIESGGGGKIINSKVNGSTSTGYARGIDLAMATGISTSVLLVTNTSIENLRSGNGINIATAGTGSYSKIVLNGIQFSLNGSGSAINIAANTLGEITDVVIDNILGTSSANGAPVIALSKVQNVRIGSVVNDGFASIFTQTGSSGVTDDTGAIAAGVAITGTPSSGDVPIASSGTAAAWGAPSGGASALDDLTDVTITSPGVDDDLRYNGAAWVNDARKWEAVTDGEDVFVWESDDLVHEWSV